MKKTITMACALLLGALATTAQNDLGKSDDQARIALTAFVPEQIDGMPAGARETLRNKLDQAVTANGFAGTKNQRFIITANVAVLTKDMIGSAPPMIALNLEITFFVGDGMEGIKFASMSKSVKGVDVNETKAYNTALKNINTRDPEFADLLETGKARIIEYYNSKCDFIVNRAKGYAGQQEFDKAIAELMAVPEVCAKCHEFAMDAAGSVYKAKLERECQVNMALAKAAVAEENFGEAARVLSTSIHPGADCHGEASKLMADITKRADAQNKRNWNFEMKKWDDGVDISKQWIAAYRDVGVAYGQNQQPVTYRVNGWW